MRHIDFTNAPKVWRTLQGGMRVRVVCPTWLAQQSTPKAQVPIDLVRPRPLRSVVIIGRICRAYGVTPADVKGHSRKPEIMMARKACCYWLRRLTDMSYPKLGRIMGNKDHTTVLHAVKTYPSRRAKAGRFLPSQVQ